FNHQIDSGFDYLGSVYLDRPAAEAVTSWLAHSAGSPAGVVVEEASSSNQLSSRVDTPKPAILVLNEYMTRDWSLEIDRVPAPRPCESESDGSARAGRPSSRDLEIPAVRVRGPLVAAARDCAPAPARRRFPARPQGVALRLSIVLPAYRAAAVLK